MEVRFDGLLNRGRQVAPFIGRRKAARKIGKRHAVRVFGIAHVDINGIEHGGFPVSIHALLGAQPSLFQEAVERGQRQVFFWMRHGDFAKLGGMLELVMRTHNVYQKPAIRFQPLDDVAAFHALMLTQKYTHLHNIWENGPTSRAETPSPPPHKQPIQLLDAHLPPGGPTVVALVGSISCFHLA